MPGGGTGATSFPFGTLDRAEEGPCCEGIGERSFPSTDRGSLLDPDEEIGA